MPPSPQSKRWVFTLNNYTADEESTIATALSGDGVVFGIYGKEVGQSGTPHLQGFVIFSGNRRLPSVKSLLGNRIHAERARGTSQQARDYCRKDGDFNEYGTFPESSGSRSDLDALLEWGDKFTVDNGRPPSSPDIAREQPHAYLKYPRIVRLFESRAPPPTLQQGEPLEWQTELAEELLEEADDRKILFVVDEAGGLGKTWFQRWFISKHPGVAQVLSIGKRDDLAHAIDTTCRCFFFNIARDQMQFLQYSILEHLKDRMIFSPKYNSRIKYLLAVPHVVVFCNEEPDMTKLTSDRYDKRYYTD